MSLEAADKAIFVQQVKHHHVWFDVDLQYSFQLGSFGGLWLTYTGCQMVFISQKVEYLTAL